MVSLREPQQFLHDALPRARAFLDSFDVDRRVASLSPRVRQPRDAMDHPALSG
jgi:hypothetical protein